MNQTTRHIALLAGMALAAPAMAQVAVQFDGRLSQNHIYYFGGFAISQDEGADGVPPPLPSDLTTALTVTDPLPPTLAIAGNDHLDINYLFWTGTMDIAWDQTQTYSLQAVGADVLLAASGSTDIVHTSQVCGLGTCNPASELHWSTNAQSLDLAIDGPTLVDLAGSTSGGQWVDVLSWSEIAQNWVPVVSGFTTTQNTSFALQRTLQAGQYRLRNNTARFVGGAVDEKFSWDYTLTLHDATLVGAVPEPGTWALWAVGALALAQRRRRCGGIG
jgi:hypothetical protein